MKFIFPRNYNYQNKMLGIIDYNTAIFNIIFFLFTYLILSIFIYTIYYRIFALIILCMPLLLFSIIGFNNENFLYVLKYLIHFLFSNKIYIFFLRPSCFFLSVVFS